MVVDRLLDGVPRLEGLDLLLLFLLNRRRDHPPIAPPSIRELGAHTHLVPELSAAVARLAHHCRVAALAALEAGSLRSEHIATAFRAGPIARPAVVTGIAIAAAVSSPAIDEPETFVYSVPPKSYQGQSATEFWSELAVSSIHLVKPSPSPIKMETNLQLTSSPIIRTRRTSCRSRSSSDAR